jgi:hypothetical protein
MLRDAGSDLAEAVAALDRSATEPGASWWPALFLALVELRRGEESAARERVREAREKFAPLSMTAVKALFDGSHVIGRWRAEFDRLPDMGLPRD